MKKILGVRSEELGRILYVDTTDPEILILGLIDKNKTVIKKIKTGRPLSELITLQLEKFLAKAKVRLENLERIAVHTGPGHFSRLRTGIAVANALAYAQNIPLVQASSENLSFEKLMTKKIQKIIKPKYGGLPNITKPRKLI